MKAKELRIGNWVFEEVGITALNQIQIQIGDLHHCVVANCKGLQPIQLTEEWLVKFNIDHELFSIDIFKYDDTDDSIYIEYNGCELLSDITYVHQLQNLYFALTGEEC